MKVFELIKKLKKMPQNATVAFRDHDQDEAELNCFIGYVETTDFKDMQPNMRGLNQEVVVIS